MKLSDMTLKQIKEMCAETNCEDCMAYKDRAYEYCIIRNEAESYCPCNWDLDYIDYGVRT